MDSASDLLPAIIAKLNAMISPAAIIIRKRYFAMRIVTERFACTESLGKKGALKIGASVARKCEGF